ncbi:MULTISPECIES: OmpA family protein [unclassified Pseudodesulfovibrio]|uniref:OmpA/MotB family protein n=1 Tax=unclassified Pseudodesulfovibrio TaxID=2661612 RepID=UPI000FEBE7B5|nr:MULTISPECIES: OmpA family protein [unclassified Pseudodesulfovibrio]MCJ2166062.1 OmpA family protein [Pseudodesulfovibrio sp. S3-i]RWU02507.1 flagellar motor protein MotB [Pseudodesulfovibrio sp. S3]
MAKKKEAPCPPLALWLITFSDLMTLLLTFFVLLLTMASMDNAILTTVTLTTADLGLLERRGSGRVNAKERMVVELMEKPWEVLDKQQRIKDLLFPDDILPDEIKKADLDDNLDVLAKQDGVALVFTDEILFDAGGSELSEQGKFLMSRLVPMMTQTEAPINVAGFTDASDGAENSLALSGDRALTVLAFLVDLGVPSKRFTLSAYGNAFPVINDLGRPVTSPKNRRVEILLKTARPIGGYQ